MTDEQVVWQKFTSDRVMRYLLDRLPPPLRPAGFAYDYGKDGRMNEQEWLTGTDPAAMLRYMTCRAGNVPLARPETLISDRKLRLFAVGCCRLVWDGAVCDHCEGEACLQQPRPPGWITVPCPPCLGTGRTGGLTDPRSRRAVETAERYADGEADFSSLYIAEQDAQSVWGSNPEDDLAGMARYCCIEDAANAARRITTPGLKGVPSPDAQADLLRCVAGNPFRPWMREDDFAIGKPLLGEKLNIFWLSWLTPNAIALARTAYADRDWSLLPVLADALEDGGCDSADLLTHLRGGGPHCRGCWAVDLILGKE